MMKAPSAALTIGCILLVDVPSGTARAQEPETGFEEQRSGDSAGHASSLDDLLREEPPPRPAETPEAAAAKPAQGP
ncbi:MAG: hypothetical protein ACREA0_01545, partial [bacterium]